MKAKFDYVEIAKECAESNEVIADYFRMRLEVLGDEDFSLPRLKFHQKEAEKYRKMERSLKQLANRKQENQENGSARQKI